MPKEVCAFAIQLEGNAPALLVIGRESLSHTVAEKIRAYFHQELFFNRSFFTRVCLRFDSVARRHQVCAFSDLCNQPITLGMNKAEFQLRYLRQLLPRRHNLFRIESGDLHKNAVATLWRDDRFADAELIDALPYHLDCLIESVGTDRASAFRGKSD